MPFFISDLEAHPTPLLVMARDHDHGKRPWSEGPSLGVRLLPSCHARTGTGPTGPHRQSCGAIVRDGSCLFLLLVMGMIITCGLV
jgi:hypothetical protein